MKSVVETLGILLGLAGSQKSLARIASIVLRGLRDQRGPNANLITRSVLGNVSCCKDEVCRMFLPQG
jgi:hypothetical protein